MTNNNSERTLIIVKPDGVRHGQIGEVLRRIETRGYVIEALQMLSATEEQLAAHYVEHVEKPFYPSLSQYMQSGRVVALVVSGADVVQSFRAMAGATNPTNAAPGTIRGDLARNWGTDDMMNVVHGSDSSESAEREIAVWFPALATA